MNILEDGLIGANDFPESTPELRPPPKAVPHWAQDVPDALTREEYLAIGRPLLVAAGFLQPETAADPPPLPRMPDTPKKRAKKVATPPAPKAVKDSGCPF